MTIQQVCQKACKTQIPPYGLKQRRRPNSEYPYHGGKFRLHPGSNAAAVTPREPKFTNVGEAHRA